MTLRKSTRIWLALFAAALLAIAINGKSDRLGLFMALFYPLAYLAAAVLIGKGLRAAFRVVIHRLTLRLAFSYFLIGIVPIPLLAALLFVCGYVVAQQFIATRTRREVSAVAERAAALERRMPELRVRGGKITASDVPWAKPGDAAPWAAGVSSPRPLLEGANVWIAVPIPAGGGTDRFRLLLFNDPRRANLQRLSDATGYAVEIRAGKAESRRSGYTVNVGAKGEEMAFVRPRGAPPAKGGGLDGQWLVAVYLERPAAVFGRPAGESDVVIFLARASPRTLFGQLFAQGVPEIGRVFRIVLVSLAAALLFVYAIALLLAFVLVGAIARNVNKLTRATRAVSRGDFSVRVYSRSRDQIGDLARSFDGMAESIQKLLLETAHKERLEAELALARAVQDSFLPESRGNWKGFRATAHFEPVADLGGDYYDILPMPDGRTAVSIGDVSGHGLPTALLAVSARASLASFVELGVPAPESFARLEQRARRAAKPTRRLYTTLAFFAYDAQRRVGTLTNAGHPAPYRISGAEVERLALPALPIGLLPALGFPSKEFPFAPGDRLVLFTDGVVEAVNAEEEPFGYERFEELLAREGGRPAEELIQAVLSAVSVHVGATPLEDDRTLLVLRFDEA